MLETAGWGQSGLPSDMRLGQEIGVAYRAWETRLLQGLLLCIVFDGVNWLI